MSDISHDQVLISRAEYDEFLAWRAARARPPEVAAMIAAGASPVRAWRRWRGLTQAKLASMAGMAQGHLSEIEAGTKGASRETLVFLALALKIDPAAL